MCGIIGYIGNRKASSILGDGLKRLEYRGYDSIGFAIKSDNKITIEKDIGRVEKTIKKLKINDLQGTLGIAHTRWATTGAVTKKNSHPHASKNFAVVHNGIIENFQELKQDLKKKGFTFLSKTDTEVIPLLIQYNLDNGQDIMTAFTNTIKKIRGSYAIAMINTKNNAIYFARNGSPLLLGIGRNENFLASDVPAFLEHTNKVIYLDDEEYGFITDKECEIRKLNTDEIIKKEIKEIHWNFEQAKKGDYPHFMLKEINEQKNTVKLAIEQDKELIEDISKRIKESRHVFFVGCGTSYHACVSASYLFSKVTRKHVNCILASEFRNYEHFLDDNTLIIAVSQSGETADLLDAVKFAKKHLSPVICIANVMGSSLTRIADNSIMMNAGPEICVLSTKSYTSQLAIMTLLAYAAADKYKEGKSMIENAISHIPKIIDDNITNLDKLAKKIKDKNDMFLIGRDLAFPTALEGALKIKEVSYIHAEGFAGGELKHGTIALIEPGVPVFVFSTDDTRELTLSNAMEIKSRGGHIIGISSKNNEVYDDFISVPSAGNADPILMIIPIQIISYYLALKRGCDPDKPRSLAKCVTVR